MRLTGHGISAALPRGWEGGIVRQPGIDVAAARHHSLRPDRAFTSAAVATSLPAVHLANFPLPAERGDFGSGAVEVMGPDDVFMSLVEYGPENVGTPLFAAAGPPTRLSPGDFSPHALQRTLPGQAGYQAFFTTAGRAFCLYVVLGDRRNAGALVAAADAVLAELEIGAP
jgi:hypothetical protein